MPDDPVPDGDDGEGPYDPRCTACWHRRTRANREAAERAARLYEGLSGFNPALADPQSDVPPPARQVVLEGIKYGVQRVVDDMPFARESMRPEVHRRAWGRMALELRTMVLAEQLPPQTVQHTVRGTARLRVTGEVHAPRHATWLDHWKDTYRQRGWARLIGSRRWRVRYIETPHRWRHDETRPYVEHVAVPVRTYWKRPKAPAVQLPEWGEPVLTVMVDEPARGTGW